MARDVGCEWLEQRQMLATATQFLASELDREQANVAVYADADSASNHFAARGLIGDPSTVAPMKEGCTAYPASGSTCIRATFTPGGLNWGGWVFLNGVLQGNDSAPRENWGSVPNAGLNLSGATKLTFWARGKSGGERVNFFALGAGRGTQPYPDSSDEVGTGFITLNAAWTRYVIDLAGKDLSYVLNGFGWVTNADENSGRSAVFFMDNIQYKRPSVQQPQFLLSFPGLTGNGDFDRVNRNVAFTYDNAAALLAFVSANDQQHAATIADALIYAQRHDRSYCDGRLRNAYEGGDLALPPGWAPNGKVATARMPGCTDAQTGSWVEDKAQVSTYTGNMAWAMLGLLAYQQKWGGTRYLNAAARMGDWVDSNVRDTRGAGGYCGGFEGWEPSPTRLLYKSTEHNIDLMAAFKELYRATGDTKWSERSAHARTFVLSMWDASEGKFWTGTTDDGVTTNRSVVPVDAQAWAILALAGQSTPYQGALNYARANLRTANGGYDFNQDLDGTWYEGTAQMATAFAYAGKAGKRDSLIALLEGAQLPSGAMYAADRDGLTTGFDWLYFRQPHIGATAWLALAQNSYNPFTGRQIS